MSEKLQKRLVHNSFLALFLVLTIILSGMFFFSYRRLLQSSDKLLDWLWENCEYYDYIDKADASSDEETTVSHPLFFAVIVDSETNEMLQISPPQVSREFVAVAEEMTQRAVKEGDERGFVQAHRFIREQGEPDHYHILFVNCEKDLEEFNKIFILGIVLSLVGLILAVSIITATYHRAMHVVSENSEKYRRYLTDSGHEFKTPIAIILTDVDVLEMELKHNEWLRDIRTQAMRLDRLTSDLGFLAQMEQANIPIQMIDFPVSDVIAEAAASFQMLAGSRGLELDLQIQPMLSMHGNDQAIEQLTIILMDNALKYAAPNSRIVLKLAMENSTLNLSVYNKTEFKVEKETAELLFERFYRTESVKDSGKKGSGIGLSLAKAIVNAHNGKIQAFAPEEDSFQIIATFPQ